MSACPQSLTIALDARTIHRAHRRGIGKSLADLYAQVLALRPSWRVLGYHRGPGHSPLWTVPGYVPRALEMRGDRFDAWQRWRLPLAAWRDRADVLHCPANTCPHWTPVPTMVTVHDLLPLGGEPLAARRFERSVSRAVRRGRMILTPSEFTAGELVERFAVDRDRIAVNPWAPSRAMVYQESRIEQDAVRQDYGLPRGPFVLHLGAPDPRKNTRRVIEAFAALPEPMRRAWSLLVVGVDDPAVRAAFERLGVNLGLAGRFRVHSFADEADLPALFSAADVLAYPSLGEGFGLPILDAFATRTAVLTSHGTSLPEVARTAAVYVEPTQTESIARGLAALMGDAPRRQAMVERGLERLRAFSWQATALRFIAAVERTVQLSHAHDAPGARHAAA